MSFTPISLVSRGPKTLDRLGEKEPKTVHEAQAILESIRREKGYLDSETLRDLENLQERNRQEVMRLAVKSREMEAAYTTSISKQLYSSKYRLFYELIQNADDADYSALRSGSVPYIKFQISPTALVVETNENGFKRENVEAICATGKSSKKAEALSQQIGEKGFGFKSVFSVANEVHVQSGVWSFRFIHNRGEDGLGMVTPLEADFDDLPLDVATRITLKFPREDTHEYARLLGEITKLPETTLLHLHNLKRINIQRPDQSLRLEVLYPKQHSYTGSETKAIEKSVVINGKSKITHSYFHVFESEIEMPEDERRQGRTISKIELAFPFDASTLEPKPSEGGQYVFAYLPLHQLPIQFVVQGDFITTANRENIDDCTWNDVIRDGVVSAFCRAMSAFALENETSPMNYMWLHYVPTAQLCEGSWESLYASIKSELQNYAIFKTWKTEQLKKPMDVRRVKAIYVHNNKPIFSDYSNELYITPKYNTRYNKVLADLGICYISFKDLLSRARADPLRVKTFNPADTWHQACAELISYIYQKTKLDDIRSQIRKLAIIPVNNGKSWTGAPGVSPGSLQTIYFPTTDGVEIPQGIGLHLVDAAAASIPQRKELFRLLGVLECPKSEVLDYIEKKHRHKGRWDGENPISSYCASLRYMFWFHSEVESVKPWLEVLVNPNYVKSTSEPLYFPSDKKYDTQKLLQNDSQNSSYTGVAYFIHSRLLQAEDKNAYCSRKGMSWETWLQTVTGARYHPPLLHGPKSHEIGSKVPPTISKTMLAVLENRPKKFVGLLRAHWNEYREDLSYVLEELKQLEVPCQPYSHGKSCQLQLCYSPTSSIMSELRTLEALSCVPILQLPDAKEVKDEHRWEFLSKLGVRTEPSLDLYLEVHKEFVEYSEDEWEERDDPVEILEYLYTAMARLATSNDYERLRTELENGIFLFDDDDIMIKELEDCLWEGPEFLSTKASIKQHYGHLDLLERFFTVVLGIRNYSLDDIIAELIYRDEDAEFDDWRDIYSFLYQNVHTDEEWEKVRDVFKKCEVIEGQGGITYTLDRCLWTSPAPISGYTELSLLYPDLKGFFVDRLGVKSANPAMLINEIKEIAAKHSPEVDGIRQRLIGVGTLILKQGIDKDITTALDKLVKVKFLPQKRLDGSKILVGKDDIFFLNDHQRFGEAFKNQSVLLDFDSEEVHVLSAMLKYMAFDERYLSQAVEETSSVGEGAVKDKSLTHDLESRAYALYCCAVRYKSTKALRNDVVLFKHLSKAQVYSAEIISTDLVLNLKDGPVRVKSDRLAMHHAIVDDQLVFYVPKDERQRKSCYRSQFPRQLADILGVERDAIQAISQIMSHDLWSLDEILQEQDIPLVDWIPKSTHDFSKLPSSIPSEYSRRSSNSTSSGSDCSEHCSEEGPTVYEEFVEEVAQSAYRARNQRGVRLFGSTQPQNSPPTDDDPVFEYDHEEVFGKRDEGEKAHDMRIGATGESYVYETLSKLNLPNFGKDNWRSTIRGHLSGTARYADMNNWEGRETADFVYKDCDGRLTRYLRDNCFGGMPVNITEDRDFVNCPIEYYLEVKTTAGSCNTRFFMSGSQYRRMVHYCVPILGTVKKLYVILRVFNLGPNTDMRIFVDPHRFSGVHLDIECGTYHCKTKNVD